MPDNAPSFFRRRAACPGFAELQAYGAGSLPRESDARVREHLPACEFCGAALMLLMKHPPGEVVEQVSEAPLSVLLLAGALLPQASATTPTPYKARQKRLQVDFLTTPALQPT